jgi:hypothetical protein
MYIFVLPSCYHMMKKINTVTLSFATCHVAEVLLAWLILSSLVKNNNYAIQLLAYIIYNSK